jgi:hypothetical protein
LFTCEREEVIVTATESAPEITSKCRRLIEEAKDLRKQIKKLAKATPQEAWRLGRILVEIEESCPAAAKQAAYKRIGIGRTMAYYCRKVASLEHHEPAQFKNKSECLRYLGVKFTGHRLRRHDELTPKNACLTAMDYIQRSTDPANAAKLIIRRATEMLTKLRLEQDAPSDVRSGA